MPRRLASSRRELSRVFEKPDSVEPVDIVDIKHSILHEIGSHVFRSYRLYVVHPEDDQDALVADLKQAVKDWK
jgi:hypothetical protein